MKTTKLLICAVALAAAFAAVQAQGQNLSATLVEINPGLPVTGTFDNGSYTPTNPAGLMRFTNFDAFCVEPLQPLSYGQTLVYQIQDPITLGNSDKIARLVGGYLASSQTALDAAAVQWAIWETTTETLRAPSLFDGNVRVSVPVSVSIAVVGNQYLANINNYAPVSLIYLTNSEHQDVVTWCPVPEPASSGLAALSTLILLRRRRR